MKNILVLAPHTDDGELGCGATIHKHLRKGDNVVYFAFSTCEESVPKGFPSDILAKEVRKATAKLGINTENLLIGDFRVRYFPSERQRILEKLVELKKTIEPDIVYTPSSFDVHQDHKTIHEESVRAFKNTCLLGYEFMWNNFSFGSTYLNVLTEEDIEKKIEAVKEYKSQAKRFYAGEEMIKGQARFRGLQVMEPYAEAFEVIRWIER